MIFLRIIPEPQVDAVRPIVIAGAGGLGLQVAEHLSAHGESVILVDPNLERIQRARERDFDAVAVPINWPDPDVENILDRAKTLVCVFGDVDRNFRVCEVARTVYGVDHIVARVPDPGAVPRFERIGVTTMNAAMDQAVLLGLLARNPAAYNLLTRTDDDKDVCEVTVYNQRFLDKPLRQVAFPGDLLILAVSRNGELMVPHGDTRLTAGDKITLLGRTDCIEIAREMM
jgi:Trk K+ transport system NAD-binding subunit